MFHECLYCIHKLVHSLCVHVQVCMAIDVFMCGLSLRRAQAVVLTSQLISGLANKCVTKKAVLVVAECLEQHNYDSHSEYWQRWKEAWQCKKTTTEKQIKDECMQWNVTGACAAQQCRIYSKFLWNAKVFYCLLKYIECVSDINISESKHYGA